MLRAEAARLRLAIFRQIGVDAPSTKMAPAECVDRCRLYADVHASVNSPDIGLPPMPVALDFSGNDTACSDHV